MHSVVSAVRLIISSYFSLQLSFCLNLLIPIVLKAQIKSLQCASWFYYLSTKSHLGHVGWLFCYIFIISVIIVVFLICYLNYILLHNVPFGLCVLLSCLSLYVTLSLSLRLNTHIFQCTCGCDERMNALTLWLDEQ